MSETLQGGYVGDVGESKENDIGATITSTIINTDQDDAFEMQEEKEVESKESPWMQNMFTKIYQDLRSLSKDFNVQITVPELLFFGFQSSGKTTTLSVLAKTPVGTMKDGVGTRCPVRYTLTQNEELTEPRLTVNGVQVSSYAQQTKAICDHMESLAKNDGDKFSSKILEATIESCDVPNIIFVDMPGLIKKDNAEKYKAWKKQLEKITRELGTRRSANGETFAFIPVLVREAIDTEADDGYEINTIDRLLGDKRPDWKKDTLFVINKFDTQGNRAQAKSFVKYMQLLCKSGRTVITCGNPDRAPVSRLKPQQLVQHIRDVPNQEDRWWGKIIGDFRRNGDPDIERLQDLKQEKCGLKLMNQILVDKMCYIVKNTLPQLQSQLDQREQDYKDYLSKLEKQMELDDPEKLKQRVSEFYHKYLETLKQFYQGRDLAGIRDFRQTWEEDIKQFRDRRHFRTVHKNAQDWDKVSYINPHDLKALLKHMKRDDLVHKQNAGLLGGVSIRRALDLWIVMMSLMPFPDYTHEDILNASDPFGALIQADPWKMVRNIVYHASIQLRKGCIWLGEYLRFRLKYNADMIFQACLSDEFSNDVRSFGDGHGASYGNNYDTPMGGTGHLVIAMNPHHHHHHHHHGTQHGRLTRQTSSRYTSMTNINNMDEKPRAPGHLEIGNQMNKSDENVQKLLQIGLNDYKKLIDKVINEFQEAVEVVAADHAEILDRKFHEDIINLSDLIKKMLDKDLQLVNQDKQQIQSYVESGTSARTRLIGDDERKEIALQRSQEQERFESGSGSTANQDKPSPIQEEKKQELKTDADDVDDDDVDPFELEVVSSSGVDSSGVGGGSGGDSGPISDTIAADAMHRRDQYINLPLTKGRDIDFYCTLFPKKPKRYFVDLSDDATMEIKKLARVVFTCIKKQIITTTQQTLTNRVLSVLKGHGDRCHSALLVGMDWPHIQQLVGQLQDATKIPRSDIEKMIKENSKIEQQKGIGQMTNQDIADAYGSKIKQIKKEYNSVVDEYQQFLNRKKQIEIKIEALYNMDISVQDIN